MTNFDFTYDQSDQGLEGRFSWKNSYSKIFESYYLAVELYQSGDINKALNKFRYILKNNNDFVPALNELGWHFTEHRNFQKAKKYYKLALEYCQSKIPISFKGIIPWHYLENRHYLRTLQGFGVMYIHEFQFQEGLELLEKNLALNPNDNHGIRYLLGDVYLLLNDQTNSERFFNECLDYSPYRYSYGVLLFNQRKYIDSIIQFSRGILEDEFIYKVIAKKEMDSQLIENYKISCDIDDALSYHSLTLPLWFDRKLKNFLNQIYDCDLFQIYREEVEKMKKKSEFSTEVKTIKIEHIVKRKRTLIAIEDYKKIMDSEFADRIYQQIKNKF